VECVRSRLQRCGKRGLLGSIFHGPNGREVVARLKRQSGMIILPRCDDESTDRFEPEILDLAPYLFVAINAPAELTGHP
jgi:hypothetical protein